MSRLRERRKAREAAALSGLDFIGRVRYKKKRFDKKVKLFRHINKALGKLL